MRERGWGGPSSNEGERHCGTVYVQYMYSICTLFKIIVGATRPKHNIIVGAT